MECAPGFELGILGGRKLTKGLFSQLPVRLVLKRQVHMHHEGVRIGRIFYHVGPGFRSEFDRFEVHRGVVPLSIGVALLLPEVKLDLHLRRNPQNFDSELFFLSSRAGANHDLPRIVYRIEQNCHFRRPRSESLRPLFNERCELFGRTFGLAHANSFLSLYCTKRTISCGFLGDLQNAVMVLDFARLLRRISIVTWYRKCRF